MQTENVHNLVAVVYFGVEHLRDVNEHYGRRIANTVLYQPIFNVNTKRIALDEADDEVADLAALPNVKLGPIHAGTTYSEIAAFARLPLDFAQFDETVVREFRVPRAMQIMQHTLNISRDNGAYQVVFNGVETPEQVDFIRSIGGSLVEGTLLCNAMSANEFLMRLETMGTVLPDAALPQAEQA